VITRFKSWEDTIALIRVESRPDGECTVRYDVQITEFSAPTGTLTVSGAKLDGAERPLEKISSLVVQLLPTALLECSTPSETDTWEDAVTVSQPDKTIKLTRYRR